MTPLELRHVSVPVGERYALRDVSMSIAEGERVALLGLNGSGKTSLLLAIAGLVPHEGEVFVGGQRLTPRNASEVRERIGFVFAVPEDQLLFPRVDEDVAFGHVRRGVKAARALELASKTLGSLGAGFLADRATYELSHGERLRVALAGALTTKPELLLLDEPSSGLDPPGQDALAALLSTLPSAALIATHDIAFAKACCRRFVLLAGGALREDSDIGRLTRGIYGAS